MTSQCRTFLLSKKPKLGLKSPLPPPPPIPSSVLLLDFDLDACLRLRRELAAAPAMSIFEYNGSAVVAMVGKNCFAIASDRRLGVQLQTVATDFQRVFKIHDKLYIGLSGLATDAQTLYQRLVFRHKLYQLREERDMKPQTFASLVSALLYEKRFGPYFCQPVIAGLGEDNEPFICTMDCIGAKELAKDFVVSGTASESLYGACESMYKPNMEPEELFETISQALQSSVDRDCLSGWGGFVLLVTPTEVKECVIKGRMD
uniref:Proteasome subunit beta n=1 Tax=Oryza punctata TaxID=4537 RepID=A0A0E0LDW4_ORYPU